jgi:cation/acetate symporter
MMRLLPPERDIGVLRAPVRSALTLTGVYVVLVMAVALLDRIGVGSGFAPFALIAGAFAVFVLAALYAHSRRATDFYIADRRIGSILGGLDGAAVAAGLLAIGLVGGAFESATSFLVAASGLGLGYLVLGIVVAPGLRASGAYSAGDFIALRFNGVVARFVWATITFIVAFLLLLAALKIEAPLIAAPLGITPQHALWAAAAVSAMAALPGGMRSLSWTQAVQCAVIAVACLVPATFFASGGPAAAETAFAAQFGHLLAASLPAWREAGTIGWALPFLLATLGGASLPYLRIRALAAVSEREAATSMVWAVLFAFAMLMVGFVLFELLSDIVGPQAPDPAGASLPIAALFTTLPAVLAGLLLAGTLAALLAAGQAALFSAAAAISHDLWDEIVDRRGPEGRRIMVARLVVIGVAALAALFVPLWPADPAALAGWAFAIAGAGTFFPLALGLRWRRCNEIGAIGGMVAGSGFTGLVLLLDQHVIPTAIVASGWASVGAPTAALAGIIMSLVVTIGLSLVTPAPERGVDSSDDSGLPIRERPA